ncbi:2Fe-2S ferredoxin-type domain containing protein [Tylopilus felleus]
MSAAIHIPVERITTSALGLRLTTGGTLFRGRPSRADIQPRRAFHHLLRRPLPPHMPVQHSWRAFSVASQHSRRLHASSIRRHDNITRPALGTGITLHFKDHKGNLIKTIKANECDDILSLAHEWDVDLEGACEGSIACSTCHVILPPKHYDCLPEPSDDENDMLDLAFGLTDTSRLGCQVHVTRDMDGMEIWLPSATRNMFVDGKKPTHH